MGIIKRMNKRLSIKWKVVFTHIIVVTVILLIFEIFLIKLIKDYYYGNVELLLKSNINTATELYDSRLVDKSIETRAKFLLEDESIPDYVDAQILDTSGKIIESTSRFKTNEKIETIDYYEAKKGRIGVWRGSDEETAENIMAVSSPIYSNGYISGIIRFTTSIEDINLVLVTYYVYSLAVGGVVLLIAIAVSILLASKIVRPIEHLRTVADNYARGKFTDKAIVFADDELGDLSNAFNYMSEEIKIADDLKNNFISSISHEIRTPLTSIMAWSETLLDEASEEEQKEGLEIIEKESKRLTGLVETLLDFSKLEADRLVPDMKVFNIRALVENIAKQFLQVAKKKKLGISTEFSHKQIDFYGDEYRLKQVLINIIDNAIKHSYNGGKINISLAISEDKKKLIIQVDDEGEGILNFDVNNLTTLFYKGDDKKEGSGIGLAVSKKIIDMHAGTIDFKPINTGGTSVIVSLPRRKKIEGN